MITVESIVADVKNWRELNNIKKDGEALKHDQIVELIKYIQAQTAKLNFSAPKEGAELILYNGTIRDENTSLQVYKLAKLLSDDPNGEFYYISSTDPGEILNRDAGLQKALTDTIGDEGIAERLMNGVFEKQQDGKWKRVSKYGIDNIESMNDFVSGKLASNATGDVLMLNLEYLPNNVLAQTELGIILKNPNVTSINGIPKSDLLEFKDTLTNQLYQTEDEAIRGVYELIYAKSIEDAPYIAVTTKDVLDKEGRPLLDSDGKRVQDPVDLDVTQLLKVYNNQPDASVAMGQSLLDVLTRDANIDEYASIKKLQIKNPELYKQTLIQFKKLYLYSSENGILGFKGQTPTLASFTNISEYLRVKGGIAKYGAPIMGVIGAYSMIKEGTETFQAASEEFEAGNYKAGRDIIGTWITSIVAGMASSQASVAAIAPLCLSVAAYGGPIGIAAAITLEIGAGILGFAIGSGIGRIFYEQFGEDIYQGLRDSFGIADYIFGSDQKDTLTGDDGIDRIFAGSGNDTIIGKGHNDVIYGEAGNDIIYGDQGNDRLYGGQDNDIIRAGTGDDYLDGGIGNDRLEGGHGSDTYYFGNGYGVDTIHDIDETFKAGSEDAFIYDTIQFGAGIDPQDIIAHREGRNLVLSVKNTTDKLIIESYYSNEFSNADINSYIEFIRFYDGTVWDESKINGLTLYGDDLSKYYDGKTSTAAPNYVNDTIYGTKGKDTIYSLNGNDKIYSGDGDDILNGGTGNDKLFGGDGTDTYVFDFAFGNDYVFELPPSNNNKTSTIKITAYEKDQIKYRRISNDLRIEVIGTDNSITLVSYFLDEVASDDFNIELKDSKMTAKELKNHLSGISKEKKITKLSIGLPDDETMDEILYRDFKDDAAELEKQLGFINIDDKDFYNKYFKDRYDVRNIDPNIKKMLWHAIYAQNARGSQSVTTKKEEFDDASQRRVDPLILDLNDNGIYTTSLDKGTHFDFAGDGFSEKTGWIEKEDGFLVLDKNQNNIIDNGNELFGDRTMLKDGTFARFGFEALAEYDINKDGKINKDDAIYNQLKVWVDANGDGVSQSGELKTLDSLNIKELNLNYTSKNIVDANGHIVSREGSFLKEDGNTNSIGELNFETDTSNTVPKDPVEVPDEIKDYMPELYATGKVYSLQQAMTLDSSLIDLVYDFAVSKIPQEKETLIVQILNKWTGADKIQENSRGSYVNAKHLYVLEQFNGRDFVGANGSNPNSIAGPLLEKAYANLEKDVRTKLLAQTDLQVYLAMTIVDYDSKTNRFESDFSAVVDALKNVTDTAYAKYLFSNYLNLLQTSPVYSYAFETTAMLDMIENSGLEYDEKYLDNNVIYQGTSENNTLRSKDIYGAVNELFIGKDGNDTIYAGNGEDIVSGGKGNDRLEGGAGNDTYVFNLGDGVDTIVDGDSTVGNKDTIVFGEGIKAEDVFVVRNGDHLELQIKNTNDKIVIAYYFTNSYSSANLNTNYLVEEVKFADGTVWDKEYIKSVVLKGTDVDQIIYGFNDSNNVYGFGGNDTIYAGAGEDIVFGGSGNDTIYGETGNDIIQGDNGNDRLEGGTGNDTYVFNLGDGIDTIVDGDTTIGNIDKIVFGEGIKAEDVIVVRNGDHLELQIKNTTDKIVIAYYFTNSYSSANLNTNYLVEEVKFEDGTVWDKEYIKSVVLKGTDADQTIYGFNDSNNIYGFGGNDNISAGAGDDTVYGGEGNDTIYGEDGNDVIYGDLGNDTIYAGSGNDLINGNHGNDRLEGGTGNDTYVFNLGDGVDTIVDYDTTVGNKDTIVFGEGIKAEDVFVVRNGDHLELQIKNTTDKIVIAYYFTNSYSSANLNTNYLVEEVKFVDGTVWNKEYIKSVVLKGTDVDQIIYGFNDSNNVYGFGGNDTIYAGAGEDTVFGGSGNDTIYGETGNDIIQGDTGNDRLEGGTGNDTYVFNLGDGIDTIVDGDTTIGNIDKIVFGEGIKAEDIFVVRNGDHLELQIKNTTDKIIIAYYFTNSYSSANLNTNYLVEEVKFVDGTVWDKEYIKSVVLKGTDADQTIYGFNDSNNIYGFGGNDNISAGAGDDTVYGGEGNDTIYGEDGNDVIYGDLGNDTIYAGSGNDLINGNHGNDRLEGGTGNDTYVFNLGDGVDTIVDYDTTVGNKDTIVFGEGIKAEDVFVVRNGDHLELQIKNTTDKIVIAYYFTNSYSSANLNTNYLVEEVKFVDGTVWNKEYIKSVVLKGTDVDQIIYGFNDSNNVYGFGGNDTIYAGAGEDTVFGGSGNDTIYGETGNDIIQGDTGNDRLEGGTGNDTYVFNLGDGIDTIVDGDTTIGNIDKIVFGEGIKAEDVFVVRNGDHLELQIKNTTDKIIIAYYFTNSYSSANLNTNYLVEEVKFVDGTVWNKEYIKSVVLKGTDADQTIYGFNDSNNIYGFGGNDTIYAGAGDDTVDGGEGNDTIYGEDGNDVIYGDSGNDNLQGGNGNDTYIFNLGDGIDTIVDYDTTSGNKDTAIFETNMLNIIFEKQQYNLKISSSLTDSVNVSSWYSNSAYQIEEIKTQDGYVIENTKVDQLIQAMSSFTTQSGVSWNDAVKTGNQEAQDIISQFWVKAN